MVLFFDTGRPRISRRLFRHRELKNVDGGKMHNFTEVGILPVCDKHGSFFFAEMRLEEEDHVQRCVFGERTESFDRAGKCANFAKFAAGMHASTPVEGGGGFGINVRQEEGTAGTKDFARGLEK